MSSKDKKNTTLDPSANPFQTLGEASSDPLSMAGGPRPSVVVESRVPTPSLFTAGAAPMSTAAAASSIFSTANPPTAKRPHSDTSYLPCYPAFNFLTNKETITSYWVGHFALAAAAQENPTMDTIVTTIAGFFTEIKYDYLTRAQTAEVHYTQLERDCARTRDSLRHLERIQSSDVSPTPTPKPAAPQAGTVQAAIHTPAPKPIHPPALLLWSPVAGRKAKKPAPPPTATMPQSAPHPATTPPASSPPQAKSLTHRERHLLIRQDGSPLTSSTVAIRDSINTALQATLIQHVVCRPDNNLTLITMDTVKAASLNSKVPSFLHLIPGTTSVRVDFPTVQMLVHGLPTDCPLPEIAQELTTFNTGLAISRPPCWLIPEDRRASKRISTVVLSLAGSKARDVSSRSRLATFSATFKVEHHLRFNRFTQCHGCHQFGHHTLRCTNAPRCRWCAGAHSTGDHTCPTSTCNAKSRVCPHTSLKCVACTGPHEAHSAQCLDRPAPEPREEGGEDDEMH